MMTSKKPRLPEPQPGRVISYAYLWCREAAEGRTEGRKTRPSAIILATRKDGDSAPKVAVVPITHSPPLDPSTAMELPLRVQKHLGLDDSAKSWVVLNEINVFRWPGFDLQPIGPAKDKYDYGVLPPKFFDAIIKRMGEIQLQGLLKSTSRDETAPPPPSAAEKKRIIQEKIDARYEEIKAKEASKITKTTPRTLKR